MSRALLRGAACQSCRHEILRSFIAVTGIPMPHITISRPPSLNSRAFSAASPLRSDRPPAFNLSDINHSPVENEDLQRENGRSASHVPWYLQEDKETAEERLVPGDHIPETPEDSPEMLPTLLEYVYKEVGLDQLKLYDLRGLEAPAALGANVIMVIGTARSVKHLNVSADRLCRWLRSQYKLSPHADGLLGRNELKIKLRRKAKRARAASHAGTTIDEKDDGITTGWICVNAGVVDKDMKKTSLADAGLEGFGQVELGTNVVVQIFTEEKRAEVDLDGLWERTIERDERNRLKDMSQIDLSRQSSSDSRASYRMRNQNGQRRGFHTIRPIMTSSTGSTRSEMMAAITAKGITAKAAEVEMGTDSLLRMLLSLPHERVRAELGSGPNDRTSTVFLQLLYGSLTNTMSAKDLAIFRLKLHSIAISRQHPAYSKDELYGALEDFLRVGYELEDETAFDIVAALLSARADRKSGGPSSQYLPQEDIELAFRVLERLSLRGVPIFNFKVFNMLYKVVDTPIIKSGATLQDDMPETERPVMGTSGKEWTASQRLMLNRLSKIVSAAEVAFDEEEARKLMITQFQCEDYDGFWRIWHQIPLKGTGRTQDDYRNLFQLHADLGEERRARDCLSTWVPMMGNENPVIELEGPIVTSVMHCLLVAEPEIQHRVGDRSPSFHLELWRRCQDALSQPRF
ncbi:ATPase synthesis protein 25 [Penicillium diatomitis]|uniref:ATPase synthesis protein 25 n=1 Tax=Penicillium diatomitis TaxID=2819901 RepID=A0A9X0BXN0_9EURO|nr:ATPase synthesis protein 25 [Penicillium diatomitis]KAJ5488669.1 ATPase synthesis protein 25 [Penicillium diatomitis]